MPSKVVSKHARETRLAMIAFLEGKLASEYPGLSRTEAQIQLGKDAGKLSLSTMQRIMSGKTGPSIDTLSDIAYALGCSVGEMLTLPHGIPPRPEHPVMVETGVTGRFRHRLIKVKNNP